MNTNLDSFPEKIQKEIVDLQLDFSALLAPLETVVTHTWTLTDKVSGEVEPSMIVAGVTRVNGAVCSQRVTGGTAGSTYTVECEVITSAGRKYVGRKSLSVSS